MCSILDIATVIYNLMRILKGISMVKLAEIFSKGAVLQRNAEIRIFGESDRDVTVMFDGATVVAEHKDGKFCAVFPPHCAGTGYTICVSDGTEKIVVDNISVGEVFIAAGQSNMEMPLGVTDGAEDELEHCENPNISFYSIPQQYIKGEPLNMFRFQFMDYSAPTWKTCTKDTAKDFSAIGYYVAKKLQRALGVPVGVIGCNWGCRIIESFIPAWAFNRNEYLAEYKEKYENSLSEKTQEEYDQTYENFQKFLAERIKNFKSPLEISYGNANYASMYPLNEWVNFKWPAGPYNADRPGCVWHNMLEDVAPYSLKFVLWYQGEGNPTGHYFEKYGVLVDSWREAFDQQDMEFYAMELAPFGGGTGRIPMEDLSWATAREDQRRATIEYKNCHLVTSVGLGDISNVHPVYKRELAYRTARSVLYNTYGTGQKSENPYAVSAVFEEDCVRVKFENDENLAIIGGAVADIYVSENGEDFVFAKAKIEDGELVVWADEVKNPCEIRYCFSTYYAGENIFNSAALPASPFRIIKK